MVHALNGARLKVFRAEEHLENLKEAIRSYIQSDPCTISVEDDGHTVNTLINLTTQPEPIISAIVGDCLHNLRSALDYVIWELAGTYANRVLEPPPLGKDKPYFPICDTAKGFQNNLATLNKYNIPEPVISELEAVQPYNAGYEPLWQLHLLINVDKHRLPLLVCAATNKIEIFFPVLLPHPAATPQGDVHQKSAQRSRASV